MAIVDIFLAFFAGSLSFFSPCVFPLIPSYILYLGGVGVKAASTKDEKKNIVANSLMFIVGFFIIFILLGAAASIIGRIVFANRAIIRVVGGVIIIILGLYLLGVFKLSFLNFEKRLMIKTRPIGYFGSVVLGMTFAAAWTPCAGPILGSILVLAGAQSTLWSGVALLIAYSLGLALPFFITALMVDSALEYFKKAEKYLSAVSAVSGVFLIAIGVLLLTGHFESIISYFN